MTAPNARATLRSSAPLARALQFGDSVFPIGGFAFSSGLESAIQQRVVIDAASLEIYVSTAVEQAASGDAVAVICAHRAAVVSDLDTLMHIDELVYARKLSGEVRTMSVRMGKKFAEMGAQIIAAPLLGEWLEKVASGATPGCYPVSLAVNFAVQDLTARDAFVVHQYGVAATILSAALRLMKIGHVDTQRILYRICASADSAYETAAATPVEDMAGFAPMMEILAAVHVKAHVRLFMN